MALGQVGEMVDLGHRLLLLQRRVRLRQAVTRGLQILSGRLLRHGLLRQGLGGRAGAVQLVAMLRR